MSLSPPTLSPHPGTATTEAAGDIQHSPKQAQMWGTQPTHGEEEEGRAEALLPPRRPHALGVGWGCVVPAS